MSKRTTALICVIFLSGETFGADRHVPEVYPTIQTAIDACSEGDTITVGDGIYTPLRSPQNTVDPDINIPPGVTIRSENGPDHTIIDFKNMLSSVYLDDNSVFDGFTVENSEMTGIVLAYGSSNNIVNNCIVQNCYNDSGIFISDTTNSIVENCFISHNGSSGISTYLGSPMIINCVVTENTGYQGGGVYIRGSSPKIINCTIIGNTSDAGGGIYIMPDTTNGITNYSKPIITNCIIRENNAPLGGNQIYIDKDQSAATIRFCNVSNETNDIYVSDGSVISWGSGNIDKNPQFIGMSAGDFRLSSKSPCLNSGYNLALCEFNVDLGGNPRIINNIVDMGAYEFQGPSIFTITNVNMSSKKGLVGFAVGGTFEPQSYNGQNVHVKIGSYEEVISCGSNGLIVNKKGDAYSYKASAGKITMIKINLKTNTFFVAGKGVAESFGSPLEVAVAFEE